MSPPSEALSVLVRGHEDPVGYACPICGTLHVLTGSELSDEKWRKEAAEKMRLHCYRFCVCGAPLTKRHVVRCDRCLAEEEKRKEERRFNKAEKVSIEDYPDQPLFWDTYGPEDGFFANISDLLDYCEDNDLDAPRYVWAARRTDLTLSAEAILERALSEQDHAEESMGKISDSSINNLQAYLNEWTKEVGVHTWHVDLRRAVLLSPDPIGNAA